MVNYFYLKDGRIIKSIEELPDSLEIISKDIFEHHVNSYKNDFAKWIYDEFKENSLSSLIGNIKSKEEMIRVIRAYLKIRESKNKKEGIKENNKKIDEINTNLKLNKEEKDLEIKNINLKKDENELKEKKIENESNEKDKKNTNIDIKDIELNNKIEKNNKKEEKTENPDNFFKKNPVIFENIIDAKKENIVLEPLGFIDYDKDNKIKSLEIFKDNYAKAYQRMSFLRKSGFDTSLIEMMLFRIPPKIKLFEASNEDKDALIIKRYLNEAIEELNEIK